MDGWMDDADVNEMNQLKKMGRVWGWMLGEEMRSLLKKKPAAVEKSTTIKA